MAASLGFEESEAAIYGAWGWIGLIQIGEMAMIFVGWVEPLRNPSLLSSGK
jgi:hypothetical protein